MSLVYRESLFEQSTGISGSSEKTENSQFDMKSSATGYSKETFQHPLQVSNIRLQKGLVSFLQSLFQGKPWFPSKGIEQTRIK